MGKKVKTSAVDTFSRTLDDLLLDAKENGISMNEIAKATGISKSALSKWRKGEGLKGIPQTDYLRKLADYFQINVEWLIGTEGAERDQNTTLAATSLSAKAIQNLISLPDSKTASQVIASEGFKRLIETFFTFELRAVQAKDCIADIMEGHSPDGEVVLLKDKESELKSLVNTHRFGRYVFTEICTDILKEIAPVDPDQVIKEASALFEREM